MGTFEIMCAIFAIKKFSLKGGLSEHIKSIHKNPRKNHKCKLCEKSYSRKGDFENHLRKRHETLPFPFLKDRNLNEESTRETFKTDEDFKKAITL